MNKTYQIEKSNGKRMWVVIRQEPNDKQYGIGSKIPGYGRVIAIQEVS